MEEEHPRAAAVHPGAAVAAATNDASADDAHAGVAVLSNRGLFTLTTSFMTGYPYAVHKFYKNFNERFLLQDQSTDDKKKKKPRRKIATEHYYDFVMKGIDRIPCHLKRSTVLPHLAIAANDVAMLRVHYQLSKQPQYQGDPKLSFAEVMYVAVLLNRVEMLECIAQLKAEDPLWEWEPCLIRVAVLRDDPDMRVLDWLDAHLPADYFSPSTEYLERPTRRGDLKLVRWLRERNCRISRRAIDEAARLGHLHLLQYFYNSRHEGKKAAHDRTETEEDVVGETQERKKREYIINCAAKRGQLEAVKLLLEGETTVETPFVIDHAAANGHLEVVKYLHERHVGGCTANAMGNAAASGHLDVVEFLYEKYAFECATSAMDQAAINGHLGVLKFLHDNRIGTCSAEAMDGAAEKGHLEIVEFLHFNRTEGCTASALHNAISSDRYSVVEFLLEYRSEGNILSALIHAASLHRLEIVQLLRPKIRPGEMVVPIVEAASRQIFWTSSAVWAYLCSTQQQEPVGFLKQAVVNGALEVLVNVWKYSSIDELIDAKEFALEHKNPAFARRLESRIADVVLTAQAHGNSSFS